MTLLFQLNDLSSLALLWTNSLPLSTSVNLACHVIAIFTIQDYIFCNHAKTPEFVFCKSWAFNRMYLCSTCFWFWYPYPAGHFLDYAFRCDWYSMSSKLFLNLIFTSYKKKKGVGTTWMSCGYWIVFLSLYYFSIFVIFI